MSSVQPHHLSHVVTTKVGPLVVWGLEGYKMSIWKIAISAPTGAFDATLEINEELPEPNGEMSAKNGSGPMKGLKFDSDAIEWSTKIERPMPMKLRFKGNHGNEKMSGTVKFGIFASGTFAGKQQ
jgi:hypothetical protein